MHDGHCDSKGGYPMRNVAIIIRSILCGAILLSALLSCRSQPPQAAPPQLLPANAQLLPHCTEDRRPRPPAYKVLEIPKILNSGQVPDEFLKTLYPEVIKHIHIPDVWDILPVTDRTDDVVLLSMVTHSWAEQPNSEGAVGTMEMKLALIDKALMCEVAATVGQGNVSRVLTTASTSLSFSDSLGAEKSSGIAEIANGVRWFVENVLVHNQSI